MTSSPTEPSRRLKYFTAAAVVIGLLILYVAFTRHEAAPVDADPVGDSQAQAQAELQRQLKATLDGLRPERLNVSANAQDLVGDLNLWWADFSEENPSPDADHYVETIRNWLGEEAAANAAADRFGARDAGHIRNSLLYRAMAATLTASGQSEQEMATSAFGLICRHISLLSAAAAPVPMGSGEVLLAGRGTADDRIWAFAEVLRQLGIDCVVLEPATPPTDAAVPARLVGAIIKSEGVLLFDPQMGLPIPPLEDTAGPLPERAAMLAEARQNDAILRQFDVPDGPKYPWTSEMLSAAGVRFIVDSTYAAPRMRALQLVLPSDYGARLFDGPADAGNLSLEERVVAAGQSGDWAKESVSAWSYPEQQMRAFYAPGGEDSEEVKRRLATLSGPRIMVKREVDGAMRLLEEDSPRPLRVVRVEHLRGDLAGAREGYGIIRGSQLTLAGNPEVQQDAVHWLAVVQAELGRDDLAVNEMIRAQRNYPGGIWSSATAEALPRSEAVRGNLQRAIELLSAGDTKLKLADAWLLRRWQAQVAGTPAETPAADSQPGQ